uniref:Apple domain-containing protein n=1 Tax=Panagrolaimus superbus TaxID=310955 RepID=A0A914ZCD1_9BILA
MINFVGKISLFLCIFYVVDSIENPPLNTFVALNQCFELKKGFKIDITEAHMTGTDSIQFKDDCLRACLKTLFQNNFTCRSLMHMPRDDDCVLTSMSEYTGAKVEKVEDFGFMSTINYFENKCAKSPFGKPAATAEASMSSYKGNRAIFQIGEVAGKAPLILALIDGIRANSLVDINIKHEHVKDCFALKRKDVKLSDRLLQMFTDSSGMAVYPWGEADLKILGKNYLGSTVIIIDTMSQKVIDCGIIQIKGNPDEYEAIKSFSSSFSLKFIVAFTFFTFLFNL